MDGQMDKQTEEKYDKRMYKQVNYRDEGTDAKTEKNKIMPLNGASKQENCLWITMLLTQFYYIK